MGTVVTLTASLLALSGQWLPGGIYVNAKTVVPLPAETHQPESGVQPDYYSTRIHVAPVNTAQVRIDTQGSKDQVIYSKTSGQSSTIYLDRIAPLHPQPGRPYWNEFSINVAPINNAQTNVFYYPTTQPPEQNNHKTKEN